MNTTVSRIARDALRRVSRIARDALRSSGATTATSEVSHQALRPCPEAAHQSPGRRSAPQAGRLILAGCAVAIALSAAECTANPRIVVAQQSAVLFNGAVVPQDFIVVPFAVPVAVPSYVQYQAVPAPQGSGVGVQGTGAEVERQKPSEPPVSLVMQSCAKCHSGAQAKRGFRVDQPLTPEKRLQAISRVLADDPSKRMPKGKSLEAQTIGLLIQELSRAEKPPEPGH